MSDEHNEVMKELAALSSSLSRQEKQNYSAPEGYFEQMQTSVMEELNDVTSVETSSERRSSLFFLRYRRMAAVFLMLILGGIGYWLNTSGPSEDNLYADVSEEEMYEYIMDNAVDFDLITDIEPTIDDIERTSLDEEEESMYQELLLDTELDEFL